MVETNWSNDLKHPLLSQNDLAQALTQHHGLTQHQAQSIAKTAHGDYYKAQQLIDAQGEEPLFEGSTSDAVNAFMA